MTDAMQPPGDVPLQTGIGLPRAPGRSPSDRGDTGSGPTTDRPRTRFNLTDFPTVPLIQGATNQILPVNVDGSIVSIFNQGRLFYSAATPCAGKVRRTSRLLIPKHKSAYSRRLGPRLRSPPSGVLSGDGLGPHRGPSITSGHTTVQSPRSGPPASIIHKREKAPCWAAHHCKLWCPIYTAPPRPAQRRAPTGKKPCDPQRLRMLQI